MEYTTWTIDQLLGMAPDHLQVSAAETVALPEKWSTLGVSDGCAWGEFINNKQVPYRVVIALPEMGLSCDCPSRKRPCRHSISLSLLLAQRPNLFSPAPTPQWAASLLALPTPRTENQSPATTATALDQALATYQRRLGYVKAGMNELALWLRDMVHHGMAALVPKNALYWRQMADRLVDAQAYETAKEIRQLATMPGSRPDWPQQLLRRSGRLYLLTQGFARYDSFLPELQADMRFAVGWFPDPGSGWSETQRDTWLVVGKRHELLGRKNLLRVWLWGIELKRPALLIHSTDRNDLHNRPFFSGSAFDGTLQFFPSAWPVRAHLGSVHGMTTSSDTISGFHSVKAARTAYGRALSVNPWLRRFPLLLQSVQAQQIGQRWSLRDGEGYTLPLPDNYLNGWHLQTVTQRGPCAIFGEFDGHVFQPLTIDQSDHWLDLHVLRGVK